MKPTVVDVVVNLWAVVVREGLTILTSTPTFELGSSFLLKP